MKTKKRVLGWSPQSQVVLTVSHGSRVLQVACSPILGTTSWAILAVEGPKLVNDEGEEIASFTEKSIKEVLHSHRHESLGTAEGMKAAMMVAEAYADKWQRSRASEETCDCTDIDLSNDEEPESRVLSGAV